MYLGSPCIFVSIRVLYFSFQFSFLQQCFICLCPSLNCWSLWIIFLCFSKHSFVSNSYLFCFSSSHTIFTMKKSVIFLFFGAPSLKVNMLLYIFLFSSTYTDISSFITLYRFTQVSVVPASVLSFHEYSPKVFFFSSCTFFLCYEWCSLSCCTKHSVVLYL